MMSASSPTMMSGGSSSSSSSSFASSSYGLPATSKTAAAAAATTTAAAASGAAAASKGGRWTANAASIVDAARLPGAWEPLQRHRSVDVVLVWVAAQAVHWITQQPAEWLFLAIYSVGVLAHLLALRPITAVTWLAVWVLADYAVYAYILPSVSATTASLMVHSVIVVKLQGLNLRGVALLAIAAALVFSRDPPPLTTWHRAVAAHCTVFGCGWLLAQAAAYVYERFDEFALTHGFRAPDAPVFVIAEVASGHVRIVWSQTSPGRQQTDQYVIEVNGTVVERLPNDESGTTVHSAVPGEHLCVRVGASSGKDVSYSTPVIVRIPLPEPSPPLSILASPGPGSDAGEPVGSLTDLRDQDRSTRDDHLPDELLEDDVDPTPMEQLGGPAAPSALGPRSISSEALNELDRHRWDQMQAELHRLERQRLEMEQQLRETADRAQADLVALERETVRLREAKKQDDGSKSRLRQNSKAVEEAKTRAELAKTKVDKELRTEQDVTASLELQLEQAHSAQEQARRSLLDLEKRSAVKAAGNDTDRKTQRTKLEMARKQLADTVAHLADRRQQLVAVRAELAAHRSQAEQDRTLLGQLLTQLRLVQTHHVDQQAELRVVFERYYQLLEDNRQLQERLQEIMQAKMSLMAELTRSQKLRDMQKQALLSTLASVGVSASASSSPFKLGAGSSPALLSSASASSPSARLGSVAGNPATSAFASLGALPSATTATSSPSATTAARWGAAGDHRNAAMPVLEIDADDDDDVDLPLGRLDGGSFGPVGLFHDAALARTAAAGTVGSSVPGGVGGASGSLIGSAGATAGATTAVAVAAAAAAAATGPTAVDLDPQHLYGRRPANVPVASALPATSPWAAGSLLGTTFGAPGSAGAPGSGISLGTVGLGASPSAASSSAGPSSGLGQLWSLGLGPTSSSLLSALGGSGSSPAHPASGPLLGDAASSLDPAVYGSAGRSTASSSTTSGPAGETAHLPPSASVAGLGEAWQVD